MNQEDLKEYKEKLSNISDEEAKQRDLYLKNLANGTIQGPLTGYSSIDKQWLKYYSDDIILSDMPNESMYDYMHNRNLDNLDRIALEYYGNQISYKELFEKIDLTEKMLKNNEISEGDIVSISMPTTPETVFLLYALSKIGAVANMIDPRTSVEQMSEYIKESNSKLFIGIDLYADKFKKAIQGTDVQKIIYTSANDSLPKFAKGIMNFKDKVFGSVKLKKTDSTFSKEVELAKNIEFELSKKIDGNKTVVIVHTGGTTGPSKGVMLSSNNLNASVAQSMNNEHILLRDDTWLNIMPPFIAYGSGNGLHLPLVVGMKVVLIPKFDPTKFADLILKHKPQYMAGVPAHYENIIHNEKMNGIDLSFWKLAIVGGDSMDLNLEKETREFFKQHNSNTVLMKGYGMSEASAAVSLPTNEENNKLKSVGIPFSHTTIGVYDKTGSEVQTGEVGEILISGPNVMNGYLNKEEETNNILKKHEDGNTWVHSGDLGYMDGDGNLFIMDREKRIIVRHDGFKIFPSVIEDLINSNEMVEMCKVIGIRDSDHVQGKLPKAFIVLKPEYSASENLILENLYNMCTEQLSEYYLPITFETRTSLPLTPIGKVDYRKLEEEEENKKIIK